MNFSRLCGSVGKGVAVFNKNEIFKFTTLKLPKSVYESNCRNIYFSKITKQKVNPQVQATFDRIKREHSARNYAIAFLLTALAGTYAAVPLYRIFCQQTGFGGTVKHDVGGDKLKEMTKNSDRKIKVSFTSDVAQGLAWEFTPQQSSIEVFPGETALAFFTATNDTDKAITGVSTYNVIPFEAAPYFNKIQCFCFEEQRLNPHETVDMPVFFYIDPDFNRDARMLLVDEVILSYTFFEAKENMKLPIPSFVKKHMNS